MNRIAFYFVAALCALIGLLLSRAAKARRARPCVRCQWPVAFEWNGQAGPLCEECAVEKYL